MRPEALPSSTPETSRDDTVVIQLRSRRRKVRALTSREQRVLELTANGLSVSEIAKVISGAESTFVAEETVKSCQQSGRVKLGARSIVHAVAIALQRTLIRLDS